MLASQARGGISRRSVAQRRGDPRGPVVGFRGEYAVVVNVRRVAGSPNQFATQPCCLARRQLTYHGSSVFLFYSSTRNNSVVKKAVISLSTCFQGSAKSLTLLYFGRRVAGTPTASQFSQPKALIGPIQRKGCILYSFWLNLDGSWGLELEFPSFQGGHYRYK